ncbi:hypothetical protein L6164_000642 [Bauhinia variegata]|nr:hypothetical protein L6164_000642 [Bauhinia variegata]
MGTLPTLSSEEKSLISVSPRFLSLSLCAAVAEQQCKPAMATLQPVNCDEGKVPCLYVELDFKEVVLDSTSPTVTSKRTALIETYNELRNKVGVTAAISTDFCDIQRLNDIRTLADTELSLTAVVLLAVKRPNCFR